MLYRYSVVVYVYIDWDKDGLHLNGKPKASSKSKTPFLASPFRSSDICQQVAQIRSSHAFPILSFPRTDGFRPYIYAIADPHACPLVHAEFGAANARHL